ncbi:CDP-glycerol glycerophosphotransferase family protein [Ruminococcus flavefaciens]|uniref:CDP-glycerol glycerophosphotransferase family protein n=1 Tax=Ruminococcus flavefaciens TaxID=1265 RepID=UPI0002ED85B2|nr:CDP-glycerol glycerophosphotransferase family protein [Ruminococcus flavefaciens]
MFVNILKKVYNFFRNIKNDGLKATVKTIYYYKLDKWYIKLIKTITNHMPLRNVIIIESHDDFDCNGGAFYYYLLRHKYNYKYKIVWLLKNPTPNNLPHNVKGYNIAKPSFMKDYYICVAKFLTADNVVTPKVRNDQKEFYFTHGGITFKNVKGLIVVPDHVDYVLSASANYDPYVCGNYSIPYPNNKMLHFGYPSTDCFFMETENEFCKISKKSFEKVILWMPTFRKGGGPGRNDSTAEQPIGIPLINDLEKYKKVNDYLRENNSFMIIKIHPMQDLSDLRITDMSNIKVVTKHTVKKLGLDSYSLMKCADAFISDYSSSAYQYLLLDRPIAFVLADLKDYKLGFCVDNIDDFLPGEYIYNFDDFIMFMDHSFHGEDPCREKRKKLLDQLYEHRDGKSCKRIVRFMGL